MPSDFSFIQTVDFYFKAHMIFNLNFDPTIENIMIFLQVFIYKMEDSQKKPTHVMKELIHTLNIIIDNAVTVPLEE